MAPRTLIHIGLHKTATTSLQVDTFPKVASVNYLPVGLPQIQGYLDEVLACDPIYYPSCSRAEPVKALLDEARPNLISSEALSGPAWVGVAQRGIDHRTPVLQNLSHDFPEADILLILRRQDGYARSMYRQYVKVGGTASLARFLGMEQASTAPLFARNRFNYAPYVKALQQTFSGQVHVLFFEQMQADSAEFMSRIGNILGAAEALPVPGRRNSTRLGSRGLWVSRQLNRLFQNSLNSGAPLPRLPLRRNGNWTRVSPVTLLQDYWPGKSPKQSANDTALCNTLLASCQQDNQELAKLTDTDLAEFHYY